MLYVSEANLQYVVLPHHPLVTFVRNHQHWQLRGGEIS